MNLSRRSFVKLSAALGAAAAVGSQMSSVALADADTGETADSSKEIKRVRSCCRGCGKMECGVWVTVEDGVATRVEGDESAFQSFGHCCCKSQSSLQAAYHPDRLYHPMKRTNPRGDDDPGWERISWEEAMETISSKMNECMDKYGVETVFGMSGTSRIWGMFAYGALAQLTGSPNMAIPWQVCKGPRHWCGGITSLFQDFWTENVARPLVYTQWATAVEMSNYDDSCRTIVDVHEKAEHHILVDPRLTNLGKEADIWVNLRPGTDDAMALGWIKVILDNDLQDDLFVKRWMNAPFLYVEDMEPTEGGKRKRFMSGEWTIKTRLLKESDIKEGGSVDRYMVWDNLSDKLTYFDSDTGFWEGEGGKGWKAPTKGKEAQQKHLLPGVSQGWVLDPTEFDPEKDPALYGEFTVTLKNGKKVKAVPVWQKFMDYLDKFTPEYVSEITGVAAETIENAAITYATRLDPETGYGNGGINAQLAIEHYCNAMGTCRALEMLWSITGNYDIPGGPRGGTQADYVQKAGPGSMAPGLSEKYLPVKQTDKAIGVEDFPMLSWWQEWADDASLWKTIETGDPYPVKFGWSSTGDFMCMSNSLQKWDAFLNLDFFVCEDLWKTPTAGMADILLPAEHWIETNCPRLSQGAHGARGATVRAVDPPADVKADLETAMMIYEYMGVDWGTADNPHPNAEENLDLIIAQSGQTWAEYRDDFEENGWQDCKIVAPDAWGTYRRYETGMMPLKCFGENPTTELFIPGWRTPTRKVELYSLVCETFMDGAKDVEGNDYSPLPFYNEPPLSAKMNPEMNEKYPFTCITGRRIPVYFHSEHRQLPWCREQWPVPRCEINPEDAAELGLEQGDWVWIENDNGKIRQTVDLYYGIQKGIIHCEHQWWYPELDQADRGFDLSGINCLVTTGVGYQDPVTGSSYLRGYPVKIYKATADNSPFGNPVPCDHNGNEIIHSASDPRLRDWLPDYEVRKEA